ncbi:phosphate acyltransferase PlsX [soil metagenome]
MKAIALDAMGGDQAPAATVQGALLAAGEGIPVVLVGDRERIEAELEGKNTEALPLRVHHASDVITMEDHASEVRGRKDSSIVQAALLVKRGEASACVSMGHSGATMAAALLGLGRIRGVERPAILTDVPSQKGRVALLDVGANAECRPSHLQHFAVMGAAYARAFFGKSAPSVGLLSIGEEPHKGNDLVIRAHALLRETAGIRFYGNVEGRDLFRGTTDVVVTDGFTGNVVLKLAEGEAKVLFAWLREELLAGGAMTRLGAALVKPALLRVAARLDPDEYGGAPLLGVDGFVFIGHGSSGAVAVRNALRTSSRAVEVGLVERLRGDMAALAQETGQQETGRQETGRQESRTRESQS